MDMLFIAASTVATGKLSPLIRQGPDCRRQSSWVKGYDTLPMKGKSTAAEEKSENLPNAKLSPMHVTMQDGNEAVWPYQENLLWLEKTSQTFLLKPLKERQSLWPPQSVHVCGQNRMPRCSESTWNWDPSHSHPQASASLHCTNCSRSRLIHRSVGWARCVASLHAGYWPCTFQRSRSLASSDSF